METSSIWIRRLACLPVLFLVVLAGLVNARGWGRGVDSPVILAVLNMLFNASAAILAAILASIHFLASGSRPVLALGGGAVAFAGANILGGLTLPDLNQSMTVSDLGIAMAGSLFLGALVLCLSRSPHGLAKGSPAQVTLAYATILGLLMLLAGASWFNLFPPFYMTHFGPTTLRQGVILVSVTAFALAGSGFGFLYIRRDAHSLFWYSLGLLLMALGLFLMMPCVPGSPLCWLGRIAQYLGSLYLLGAVLTENRGPRGMGATIEMAYKESEERYNALVELLPDAVMVVAEGRCVFANKACLKLFKVSMPGALIGRPLVELAEPLGHDQLMRDLFEDCPPGCEPRSEFRINRFDGVVGYGEMTTGRIRYEGKPSWLAILRDVTERRNREAELKRLNRVLKATSSGDSAMMRATHEGDYLQEICRIVAECGYPMVWIGYPRYDWRRSIWPAAWAGMQEAALQKLSLSWASGQEAPNPTGDALRTGKTVLYRSGSGRVFPYASALALPLAHEGRTFGALTIYAQDPAQFTEPEVQLLTELSHDLSYGIGAIRLRDSHARSLEALKRSEERYRRLVEYSPDGVFVQRDGRVVFVNPAGLRLAGVGRESDVLGRSLFDLFHETHHVPLRRSLDHLVQGGTAPHTEARLVRLDGSGFRDVDVCCASVETEEGAAVQLILRDITERKECENALRLSSLELSRSNQDLEQFAHVASHDLKEPLRMVTGFMSLLKERLEGRLDAKATEYMGFIADAAGRMQRLIDDLLSYSRVGRVGVKGRMDAGDAVQSALRNLQIGLEESGAHVTVETLPTVEANAMELTQLFQNLLGNAIKFRGQTSPVIRVSASRQGQEWVFCVRDNGIGIDPQFNDRIFQIFNRLHGSDEYPGTGVGLAICKKVVERHGGRIWVESKPGAGAAFCFTLPALGEEAA